MKIWLCDDADSEGIATKGGNSKSVRQTNQTQAPVQGMRRSQRQQQQRQMKDKQLLAETRHTARISVTAITIAMPSSTDQATKTDSCSVHTASKIRESSAGVQGPFSTESSLPQQVQAQCQRRAAQGTPGKAPVGNGAVGRKCKSSPTAGVKKQTSPVGKGLVGGLAVGARFPLRVRRNAEQPSMKGDLNSKFVKAHGLGDLDSHLSHRTA